VFGPGIGEAIAVHVGNGDWIAIDSCRQPGEKRPATLDYLQHIGVDVATRVRLVVATHWHDDHVGGLAQLVEACTSAEFVCSDALTSDEFLTLIATLAYPSRSESSGVDELRDVLQIIAQRQQTTHPNLEGPRHAVADRLLINGTGSVAYEVHSLSPSDTSITLAKQAIGSLIPREGAPPTRPSWEAPNHAAVALWIKVGSVEVLLGSDLEITSSPLCGWDGVLKTRIAKGKAAVIKVAHHGSPNGDHIEVWSQLVATNAAAIVTPFLRSRRPRPEDIVRLKGRTPDVFVTSKASLGKPPKRDAAVERQLREVVKRHQSLRMSAGQVRWRMPVHAPSVPPSVDLFGSAYRS
jgi:hypothetical protein